MRFDLLISLGFAAFTVEEYYSTFACPIVVPHEFTFPVRKLYIICSLIICPIVVTLAVR